MPAAYAVRDGGDAKTKKQSMADLKLRRLQELNSRLKEDLERPRVKVAEASMRYVLTIRQRRRSTD
jgi:guanine nucleotide-binding protein subunit gamma